MNKSEHSPHLGSKHKFKIISTEKSFKNLLFPTILVFSLRKFVFFKLSYFIMVLRFGAPKNSDCHFYLRFIFFDETWWERKHFTFHPSNCKPNGWWCLANCTWCQDEVLITIFLSFGTKIIIHKKCEQNVDDFSQETGKNLLLLFVYAFFFHLHKFSFISMGGERTAKALKQTSVTMSLQQVSKETKEKPKTKNAEKKANATTSKW